MTNAGHSQFFMIFGTREHNGGNVVFGGGVVDMAWVTCVDLGPVGE